MSQNMDDFKMPAPDIDQPFSQEGSETIPIHSMSQQEGSDIESKLKMEKARESRYFRERGFKLIIICLIAYALIAVVVSIISACTDWDPDTTVTGFTELLKFIISSLIGYVFADITNKDKP